MEIDPKYKGKIAQMRNLKIYREYSDEQLYEVIQNKERETELGIEKPKPELSQETKVRRLFDKLQAEYGVDMNESNDVESLRMLAKHILQSEAIDTQISRLQQQTVMSNEDTRTLKNLGDFQRSTVTSITELQDRLGINRKARKEKQTDDIPAFIENLKKRAADYFERTTTQVRCDSCKIELGRYWLNFPQLDNIVTLELECQRCHQKVLHVG